MWDPGSQLYYAISVYLSATFDKTVMPSLIYGAYALVNDEVCCYWIYPSPAPSLYNKKILATTPDFKRPGISYKKPHLYLPKKGIGSF